MTKQSPVSIAFHAAFEAELMPLLTRLGFERARPESVKPGLIVAAACGGPRAPGATVQLWCDGGTGHNLRFRLDPAVGNEIQLAVPWADREGYPGGRYLGTEVSALRSHESPERLRIAIAFIAGVLAASSEPLARAFPDLAEDLRTISREERWVRARERAEVIWNERFVRGEVDDRRTAASLVFAGASLVVLEADGERLTFRFDASGIDRGGAMTVSGWISTPAGTRRATRLEIGTQAWTFDPSGALVAADAPR